MAQTVGGDCLADVSLLRAQPEVFGPVASDPTISRLLDTLAADVDEVVAAIGAARAAARPRVWDHQSSLADDTQVIIDLDATLIGSHSVKELASPNYKRGFGLHPMMTFVDHGHGGTGEPAAALLRTGRAGANDGQDQITVLNAALAQLPQKHRQHVVVRGDSGSGVKEFVHHIHNLGLKYSVGTNGRQPLLDAIEALPRQAWKKGLDAAGRFVVILGHRQGTWQLSLVFVFCQLFVGRFGGKNPASWAWFPAV